ncbi:MAG: flagella basal body P-ring formation protein FlgA [Microbacterium sp.]
MTATALSPRMVSPVSAAERAAPRSRRRQFFADARFYIGLALIALSIAGVWWVVSSTRTTEPVLVAAHTLVPGQVVTADDLAVVDVTLGQTAQNYLAPQQLQEGVVATRTIADGELLATSAVAPADSWTTTTVVVHSATQAPSALAEGARVEVWQAPVSDTGEVDDPRILVADATVLRTATQSGMMAQSGSDLELVIERDAVPDVLAAVAQGALISVVPQGGATP